MNQIDLQGSWQLTSLDGKHSASLPLPGDAISGLRDAGIIPDPFIGMNEEACRWVCDLDWVATQHFELAADQMGEGWYLDIDGLDTVAEIRINDQLVLSARNSFRRYRPDVSAALKTGENSIAILFRSNVQAAAEMQDSQPFFIPYHAGNCPIPHGNMLRKAQCHFGWDWNLAVPPFGVYGTLALKRMDVARIESILVSQKHGTKNGTVDLTISLHLFAAKAGDVPVRLTLPGAETEDLTLALSLFPGPQVATATFRIRNAKLWFPAGSGAQPLYDLSVAIEGETHRRRIGLRAIELVTTPDKAGARFAFRVNGREIFCRGANWIPADALPSNATPERVRKLLLAARDAHMNMLRVWGGGIYESELFYDLCDELGILIWQDAMFSCHLYPSTPEFLNEVREELAYQARRLQHRACLALWCGDNELIGALTWFEPSIKDRDRYLVNYDRLNRVVEESIKAADPEANWWPSSPSPGVMSFGDAWHQDGSGDMHFWSVWHEGKPFEHYRDVRPRFCSEFGFQSYPGMNVVRGFAEPSDWNISAPVFEAHQKNAGGNARITETMFRNFRFPKDFENFVYLSQVQHGLAMKTAIDFWRSLKPHCMGTLYWQLNDTWPVCSWSGLDHGGDWKLMHHMAQRFFSPVNVVAEPQANGETVRLIGINDQPFPVHLALRADAVTMDGKRRHLARNEGTVSPDAARELVSIPLIDLQSDEFLHFSWLGDGIAGSDNFLPRPFKSFGLTNPDLTLNWDGKGSSITIRTERPAFFVSLETALPGRFSENGFDLMPWETKTIAFLPDGQAIPTRDDIHHRNLFSSAQ